MKVYRLQSFEPQAVEAEPPLVVHCLPGWSTRLVVSLAGVGGGGTGSGAPPPEFYDSAGRASENHVLFISDASRSWLNGPGMAEEIVALIEAYGAANAINEVVLLGNSMGGFAALVLAEMIKVNTVISVSPQFSIHPDIVPKETRWQPQARNIEDWQYPTVGSLDQPDTQYFIFHGDNPWEARHWLRFPCRPELNHFIFKGVGHNVATLLRKRHLLRRVIDACIAGKPRKVRLELQRSFLGRQFEISRREVYQVAHPGLALKPGGAPVVIPQLAA